MAQKWFCFIQNPCKQICVVEREALLRSAPGGTLPGYSTASNRKNNKPEPGPTLKSQTRTWRDPDTCFWSPFQAHKTNLPNESRYAQLRGIGSVLQRERDLVIHS